MLHREKLRTLVLAALAFTQVTAAQTTPPCTDHLRDRVPVTTQGAPGVDPCEAFWGVGGTHDAPFWISANDYAAGFPIATCWRDVRTVLETVCSFTSGPPVPQGHMPWAASWDAAGFDLNVNLLGQPSIGDFLPPSPVLSGTPSPLVANADMSAPTGWQGLERPTLDGAVDLVTGLPLIQVSDLELPLDGGVFRLIRTRSHDSGFSAHSPCHDVDRWWDWAGEGWMVSENPLLLIDSAVPDIVGNQPRTTYLILDAHHSIPFQLIEDTGFYEAPARFRARLTHNGQWSPTTRSWIARPTSYEVSLYDGALRYTFVGIYDDIPINWWTSDLGLCTASPDPCESTLHARPFLYKQFADAGITSVTSWQPWAIGRNPGVGLPYYGLCTLIEDNYGHRVEINYCDVIQQATDMQSTDCVECTQNCGAKGQIESIVIRSGGQIQWTLIYKHRIAPANQPTPVLDPGIDLTDVYGRRVIDSIYVYEGDQLSRVAALNACEAFSAAHIQLPVGQGPHQPQAVDALDGLPVVDQQAATGWKHRVRYHYDFQYQAGNVQGPISSPPTLLKTTIESADETQTNGTPTARERVFWYQSSDGGPWLEAIFEDTDLDAAITAVGDAFGEHLGVNNIALEAVDSGDPNTFSSALREAVASHASVRLSNSGSRLYTSASSDGPAWSSLVTATPTGSSFVKQDPNTLFLGSRTASGGSGEVHLASIRGADGTFRYYRIFRLAVGYGTGAGNNAPQPIFPDPSVFHAPYAWRGYTLDNNGMEQAEAPADYTQARWISVIDEFRDYETMMDGSSYGSGTVQQQGYGLKIGQTSRRVAEIGASGVMLRDLTWQFSDDGVAVTGEGLGEEYVYEKASILLAQLGHTLTPLPAGTPPTGLPLDHYAEHDPDFALRRELVPVEHRSIGWSVAYLADQGMPESSRGATQGFVRFFEYGKHEYLGPNRPIVSLQLKAEGVKRGRAHLGRPDADDPLDPNMGGGPRMYTRQVFWPADLNAASLYEHECEVQFTTPVTHLLTAAPMPGQHSLDWVATHSLTFRDHSQVDPGPVPERPIVSKIVIGAPRFQRPDQNEPYFPVEREWYSETSAMTWAASGLVLNPLNPAPSGPGEELQSLTFTRYLRDSNDRPLFTILDADSSRPLTIHSDAPNPPTQADIGTPPDNWSRIADTNALNYVTAFAYNNPGDTISDVYFPGGRRWARRVVIITHQEFPLDSNGERDYSANPKWNVDGFDTANFDCLDESQGCLPILERRDYFAREYIINDLDGTTSLESRSLGEMKDYRGRDAVGGPVRNRRVYFATQPSDAPSPVPFVFDQSLVIDERTQPRFFQEAQVQLGLTSDGRVSKAELLEADPNGAMLSVGSKEVHNLIDVYREREIDGTITRTTRNKLGQPLRTYKGNLDARWTQGPTHESNLVLLDRLSYGDGVHDALMPIESRRYTYHPTWGEDYYGAPPSTDPDGYATLTGYDWRMRPVRVDDYGSDPVTGSRDPAVAPCLNTTVTILDHLDRPLIRAQFGMWTSSSPLTLPVDLNPVTRTAEHEVADPRPSAIRFLSGEVSQPPIALTEWFYGPDGTVNETRTYDVGSTAAAPRWHSDYSFSGRGGVQVYSQRPHQGVKITRVDGLGRASSSAAMWRDGATWNHELSRTDYTIDANGDVIDTWRLERVVSGGSPTLDASTGGNAVRSRSVAWYDPKKRMIASADLGTEQGAGFVAGAPQYIRPMDDGNVSAPKINFQTNGVVNDEPLGPEALLSVNNYDLATGRLTHTRHPDGSITEFNYDRAGRLASKVENRFGDPMLRRTTEYRYQYGRLIEITAYRTSSNTNPQRTEVFYGAKVLGETTVGGVRGYEEKSFRGDLIGKMVLPAEDSSQGAATDPIFLRYTFSGQIAERTDARGLTFRYFYDALDRVDEVVVGHYDENELFVDKYPASMTLPSGAPIDRVGYVKYIYDSAGRTSDVIAYVRQGGAVVTHNQYSYDARGNMLAERQLHGAVITSQNVAATPTIDYAWDYEATDSGAQIGHNRLTSMTYPAHVGLPRRVVNVEYGAPGGVDDLLSRISKLSTRLSSQTTAATVDVGTFQYIGTGRRRSLTLGHGNGAIAADLHLSTETGLAGLDRFGRIQDLHFKSTANPSSTMFRGQYAYDVAGNRTWAQITQAPIAGQPQENTRSQLNQYNQLNQLIGTQVGHLATGSGAPYIDTQSMIRSDTWNPDLLGNWSQLLTASTGGRLSTGNLDGGYGYELGGYDTSQTVIPWRHPDGWDAQDDGRGIRHIVNNQNEITTLQTHDGDYTQSTETEIRYDVAGNMIFDGVYLYQYDAWNRLIQINYGHLAPPPENLGGNPPSEPGLAEVVADELVKHFTYDGVGRLIRTQSPYPSPQDNQGLRSERFYYDGVRRIQELVADPTLALGEAMVSGDTQVQAAAIESEASQSDAAEGEVDDSSGAIAVEQEQLKDGPPTEQPIATARLEREYIWGPGDGPAGVDEMLAQFDADRTPWWVIQDAGGDIVALCDNTNDLVTGAPFVAAQWTYDAYGAVVSADHLAAHPFMRAGHKGLFFERLDVGAADPAVPGAAAMESPRLVPFAHAIVHNRNRAYNPQFGRFMQADPNAAGMSLLATAAYSGRGMRAIAVAFDLQGRYGDGANLYQYLGSNPWRRFDPMGLSWDPFDMVDEFLAEDAGSKAAWLAQAGQHARAAAIVAATVASYLPFPIASLAGDIALVALGEQSSSEMAAGIAMGLIPGGKLLGGVGGFAGRIVGTAWASAKAYAGQFGRALIKRVGGLADRALSVIRRGCGCFTPGTEVWTTHGLLPIEEVVVGDLVLAMDPETGDLSLQEVTSVFARDSAPLVEIVLAINLHIEESNADANANQLTTIVTTEEHPFLHISKGWLKAGSLVSGDQIKTIFGDYAAVVQAVGFVDKAGRVHNIEVATTHSYVVDGHGIVVHNNQCPITTKFEFHHFLPQEHWTKLEQWFTPRELDELGETIARDWHKRIHGKETGLPNSWNDRWKKWLDTHDISNTSKEDAIDFMESLKWEFGFHF